MSLGRSFAFSTCGSAKRPRVKSPAARRGRLASSFAPAAPGTEFLFPITSQLPETDRVSLAISQMESHRAGLDFPCWIILDEDNRVELDKAFDVVTTTPLGSFSPAFLMKIALTVKNAAAARWLAGVIRS